MNDFQGAFEELRQEFDRTTGKRNLVKIDGKSYPAITEEVSTETIIAHDGNGEAGGFRCMIGIADCPKQPPHLATIEAEGKVVSILSVAKVNGTTWNIVAGDPAIE